MATVAKLKFSGSSDGEPVIITATSSTNAITVHTCTTGTGDATYDEMYLWGYNNTSGTVDLTVEYGDTSHPVVQTLTGKAGETLVLPGLIGNTSLVIKAFKSSTAVVGVSGFVNRISS